MGFTAGFYFAIRIMTVLISVRLFHTEPRAGAEAGLGLNLLLLVAVCFHSLGGGVRGPGSMVRPVSIRLVLGFLAFSGCSLAWSGTVSLPASIAYWCGMAADVAIVLILLRSGPIAGVSHSLMRGFVLGACCVALAAWTMPAQPDLRLGDEEFFNTNQIGNLCAFAVFPALYLMRRAKERWGLAIFFLGVTLLRSLSKTTIAAFLVSACFLLIYDRTISRNSKVALTLTAALVVSLFWGLIEAYYDVYTTAGNQAETLTGRVGIWAFVLDAALEHPWFGHGFDSVWKVIPAFGVFEARHAENELLQQFYAYGLAGVCMLAGIYGSLCRQFMRVAERPVRAIFLSLLLYIMVRGLAEAEPFDLLLPLAWVVVLSLLADQPGTELPDALRAPHGGTALSEFF